MKKIFLIPILLLFLLIAITGCNNDDSNNNTNNGSSADQVTSIAIDGTWRITYFFDTDEDETDSFSGFNFTFTNDGSLMAANNLLSVTGTWSVIDGSENSSDDDGNSTDDDDFNILFPADSVANFADLNDDWQIVSVTETTIELTDISGGNGGTDFLTFEKNE